jgi:hypothetical protein
LGEASRDPDFPNLTAYIAHDLVGIEAARLHGYTFVQLASP